MKLQESFSGHRDTLHCQDLERESTDVLPLERSQEKIPERSIRQLREEADMLLAGWHADLHS